MITYTGDDATSRPAGPAGGEQPALRRPRRAWYRRATPLTCAVVGVILTGVLAVGIPITATATAASSTTVAVEPAEQSGYAVIPGRGGDGYGGGGTTFDPGGRAGKSAATSQADATAADVDESTGVVLIDTVLGYQDSAAAGTGMVLTSDGLILTNNHVIEGSTEIQVTVASTGDTYTATVVGVDKEDDVALLQMQGASGLDTVTVDDDAESVGQVITAVGNAEGGGVLMAADGTITALEATVTTSSDGTTAGENLDGMLEISADVVSGDSGGALLDEEGEVTGMTTAASSGTAVTTAYAIPIEDALAIVDQILAGDESDGVTLGYPAFLGVATSTSTAPSGFAGPSRPGVGASSRNAGTTGAVIGTVIEGTPAADAGLVAGDAITAVDNTTIDTWEELKEALTGYEPGDSITLTWTDTAGTSHTTTVTLTTGPAV